MLVNLTPHDIIIRKTDGDVTIPSSGVARCSVTSEHCGEVNGISIFRNVFGEVTGLPTPTPGTFFIVSFPVLQALAGKRADLVGPDTSPNGGAIRDDKGQIVAVVRFQTI